MAMLLAVQTLAAPNLIQLLISLVIIGVILYFIETLPMDALVKVIIRVVIIVVGCVWLARWAGLY